MLIIAMTFSVFHEYLGVQTSIITVLTLSKLVFLMTRDPYEEKIIYVMEIFEESAFMLQVYLLCGLTMVGQNPTASFYGVGITYIVLLGISSTFMTIVFCYYTVRECIFALKKSAVSILSKKKRTVKLKKAVSKL